MSLLKSIFKPFKQSKKIKLFKKKKFIIDNKIDNKDDNSFCIDNIENDTPENDTPIYKNKLFDDFEINFNDSCSFFTIDEKISDTSLECDTEETQNTDEETSNTYDRIHNNKIKMQSYLLTQIIDDIELYDIKEYDINFSDFKDFYPILKDFQKNYLDIYKTSKQFDIIIYKNLDNDEEIYDIIKTIKHKIYNNILLNEYNSELEILKNILLQFQTIYYGEKIILKLKDFYLMILISDIIHEIKSLLSNFDIKLLVY